MSNDHHKAPNPYAGGKHTVSLEEQTRGKLYRVRNESPEPARLWGEKLAYAAAHKLKEQVAGGRKSKNVIIEPMSTPYETLQVAHAAHAAAPVHADPSLVRPTDPDLAASYDKAMSAARSAASEAQARADAIAAAKAAKAVTVEMPELPEEVDLEAATGAVIDDAELSDLMSGDGGMPTDEEIADAGNPNGAH